MKYSIFFLGLHLKSYTMQNHKRILQNDSFDIYNNNTINETNIENILYREGKKSFLSSTEEKNKFFILSVSNISINTFCFFVVFSLYIFCINYNNKKKIDEPQELPEDTDNNTESLDNSDNLEKEQKPNVDNVEEEKTQEYLTQNEQEQENQNNEQTEQQFKKINLSIEIVVFKKRKKYLVLLFLFNLIGFIINFVVICNFISLLL